MKLGEVGASAPGLVQLTRDGGKSWTSSVESSRIDRAADFGAGRVTCTD
jgi:hypothetical protein